ncbi:MAG: hypothetical protein C5B51_15520 [Terriglobia bacterium]|nr:MAG: hypothetical protein C5B51_15520 [Terriglobia bacterium]
MLAPAIADCKVYTGSQFHHHGGGLRVKNNRIGSLLIGACMFGLLGLAQTPEEGGGPTKPVPKGPAPRMADGKPDFAGVWSPDRNFIYDIADALKPGESLPLQPWALELTKKRLSNDDPEANCLPTGVPRMAPYPWRIVQTPKVDFFLFEGNIHSYRQIFMDGRSHSKDPNPTWYGESIGKWEGDTLVIDTIGFNDRFWFDFAGHPHTTQLHTVERYRRPDLGHLEWEVTIDDRGAYTKPFTVYGHATLQSDTDLMEYICQENNKDVGHILGKDPRNRESKQGKQ